MLVCAPGTLTVLHTALLVLVLVLRGSLLATQQYSRVLCEVCDLAWFIIINRSLRRFLLSDWSRQPGDDVIHEGGVCGENKCPDW